MKGKLFLMYVIVKMILKINTQYDDARAQVLITVGGHLSLRVL